MVNESFEDGSFWLRNTGGCIARVDPSNADCGLAIQANQECIDAACASCSITDLSGCSTTVATAGCQSQRAAISCVDQVKTGPAARCFDTTSPFVSLINAFCGL
jgi:hypothetical protein